jgi:hypothetical protein
MNCRQAREKLSKYNWIILSDNPDSELLSHLQHCSDCRALLKAENDITADLSLLRQSQPESDFNLESLKKMTATANTKTNEKQAVKKLVTSTIFRLGLVKKFVVAAAVVIFLVLAFVPFNFKEKVGYEITIGGVDKDLVTDNQDITPLLQALGMEQGLATSLLDSLGTDRARLFLGECRETCSLRISELRSERDVRLVVKAIIELGCCQIEKIAPIFRDESSSLLKYAARKLNS